MTVSYRVIARADEENGTQPVVGSDTAIVFSPTMQSATAALAALQIKEIETTEFEIQPGSTVFVTLTRDSTATPSYSSEIGFMRIGGIIRTATT
jgi:hypothetical protein